MKWFVVSFIVMGILSFGLGLDYGWKTHLPPNGGWSNEVLKPGLPPSGTQEAFGILLSKTPDEIEKVDTATLGWACLAGLPGSQTIELDAARARIAKLAGTVKSTMQATLEQERKTDKSAQDCPQLRIAVISHVLEQDYKNAHLADQNDPYHDASEDWGKLRPEDMFFESAQNNRKNPVFSNAILLVAVGQALEWPIKLASIPGRLSAVWDDGKNRLFILPWSGGIDTVTEAEFRSILHVSDKEIQDQDLYHEYTQSETWAAFLQMRGKFLEQTGRPHEAALAYAAAHRFAPGTPLFSENLESAVDSATESNSLERRAVETSSPERFISSPPNPVKDLTP